MKVVYKVLLAVLFIIVVGVGFYLYAIRFNTESKTPENNVDSDAAFIELEEPLPIAPSGESVIEDTEVPGQKRFTSPSLGITFLFPERWSGEEVLIGEDGDRVYLYLESYQSYTFGQYVEVFSKRVDMPLENAIRDRFFDEVALEHCSVTSDSYFSATYPQSYESKSIVLNVSADEFENTQAYFSYIRERCPFNKMVVSEGVFFLKDHDYPNKFALLRTGNSNIFVEDNVAWQDTIEFEVSF